MWVTWQIVVISLLPNSSATEKMMGSTNLEAHLLIFLNEFMPFSAQMAAWFLGLKRRSSSLLFITLTAAAIQGGDHHCPVFMSSNGDCCLEPGIYFTHQCPCHDPRGLINFYCICFNVFWWVCLVCWVSVSCPESWFSLNAGSSHFLWALLSLCTRHVSKNVSLLVVLGGWKRGRGEFRLRAVPGFPPSPWSLQYHSREERD